MSESYKEKTLDCFTELGISPVIFFKLLSQNPSKDLPYHNNEHAYSVAYYGYVLGKKKGLENDELAELLVSGLFHDCDHTGSPTYDIHNIIRATKFLNSHAKVFSDANISFFKVKRLIESTMNSPAIKPSSLTTAEQCIRDADLLSWVDEEGREERLNGLSKELGVPVTLETIKEFLKQHTIQTEEAAELFKKAGLL